ncbi:hypothetical protein [Spiroplasma taiwanense]|uniref:Uncharacterized protein n=1 Tax=Spiroplasma taiwanense CT-1 TaxID=1276220 RepID=S5MCD4_9MOLU|nr:hypothetical protein [Spiroplasma taiwanense]AGR41398.1 hypothetical protein STAIW_v1c08100 [Spiroplasma taiwanense CT-1]
MLQITDIVSGVFSVKKNTDGSSNLEKVVNGILNSFGVTLNSETLTNEVKETIKTVGNSLNFFSDALDMSKYDNKTWTEAMNLALTELGDGIIKLSGGNSDFTNSLINAKDDTYVSVFKKAIAEFGETAAKLINEPLENSVVLNNLESISSIVNFARIKLVYISNFIIDNDVDSEIDLNDIVSFRNEKITQKDNSIDLSELLAKVHDILFPTSSGDNEKAPAFLQNAIKMLFVSDESKYSDDMILDINLANIIASITSGGGDLSNIIKTIGLDKFNDFSFNKGDFGFSYGLAEVINKLNVGLIIEGLIPGVGSIISLY